MNDETNPTVHIERVRNYPRTLADVNMTAIHDTAVSMANALFAALAQGKPATQDHEREAWIVSAQQHLLSAAEGLVISGALPNLPVSAREHFDDVEDLVNDRELIGYNEAQNALTTLDEAVNIEPLDDYERDLNTFFNELVNVLDPIGSEIAVCESQVDDHLNDLLTDSNLHDIFSETIDWERAYEKIKSMSTRVNSHPEGFSMYVLPQRTY